MATNDDMVARLTTVGDPLALDILDWLDVKGAQTTEQLVSLTGATPSAVTSLVHDLERVGMASHCAKTGGWHATDASIDLTDSDDPEAGAAVRRVRWALAQRATDLILDWEQARDSDDLAHWQEKASRRDWVMPPMTPDEVEVLSDDLRTVIERHRKRIADREAPEGAERIFVLATAFPMRARAHRD